MADINIQRKKSTPSRWLILLLVLAALAVAAYFLFRAETAPPTDVPAPAGSGIPAPPDSTTGAETGPRPATDAVADLAAAPATPEVLAAFAQGDAAQPTYGREGLRLLAANLVSLADRDDLRRPAIQTRRDDLTSAISRLDEAGTSLRPGYVAAAALAQAMQQQSYPALETEARELSALAGSLSGRTTTAAEQQQVQDYFTRAARLARALNEPPQ
ncbi:hypothetical protein [Hymenobacter swuensis]|uniref:Phospholipase C accessory protein PlcR n=1 Tax=Hymenobacter swuensis DY53 TaxID=1227739 RepID=W8EW52_9BACT|nr:hypothetical protein [Hymenobacter swuensis]AHJ95957.1 hypothetical protein Hsw_0362 [Hymenobacter swuensis DY53]